MHEPEGGSEATRWFPPPPWGGRVRWLLLAAAVATLLTNAYYLRFLEPWLSRKWLATVVIALAGAALLVQRHGLPRRPEDWLSAARRVRTPVLLALIVAAAFGLRLWGISSGLPQSYVGDEYDYVHAVLKMMKGGDLNPHWWYHPSLQPYLALVTYTLVFLLQVPTGRWSHVHQIVEEDMLYWGRFTGVVAGTGTVLLTFFLGRRLFGERVGLLAAALLAVLPGAVQHSQYNKPDPVLALMVVATVLVALSYLDQGGRARAFACGAAIGLTLAAKYNGALVAVPVLLAIAYRQGQRMLVRPDLYLCGLGTGVGFLAGCPYALAELPLFLNHVADGLYTYGFSGRRGAEGVENWRNHAKYTAEFGAGWPASLAGLAGLGLALSRLHPPVSVFLSFPVLYYAYYGWQRINFRGNLIPVYAFLAVLAAYAAGEAADRLRHRAPARKARLAAYALPVLSALLIGWPLVTSIRFDIRETRRDTGSYAREWIERTFPPGTHFALERHTPVLDRTRYRITLESKLISRSVRSYREEGVQYLVVSALLYDRFPRDHHQTRSYQKLFAICPLVAEFPADPGQRPGVAIRVLRVPPVGGGQEQEGVDSR